jgi:hypothetical protein
LRSADAPGGLESGTAKAGWLDEAGQDRFSLLAWRAIRRRLAIHQGRVLITTTLYNLGWVKQQIIDRAKGNGGKVDLIVLPNGAEVETTDGEDIRLVQFDSIANPLFPRVEYEEARGAMPDDEFDMFYRGRAAKLRTLIYDVFDDAVHKVPSFPIPREWPCAVGVDPVGTHIAAVWLAFDAEREQLHLFQEYREPFGLPSGDHVTNILTMSRGYRVVRYAGGGPSERQARLDWGAAGLPLAAPPVSDVWSQINRVYTLLKQFGLVFHDSCHGVLDEAGSYQRKRDRSGELTNEIKDKERYDLLDALRYVVAWLTDAELTRIIYAPDVGMRY